MIPAQKVLRPNIKLALICATPLTFNVFMRDHIVAISNEYRLTLVCNGSASDLKLESNRGVYFENIPIQRKVSLFFDIYSLFKLIILFRRGQFSLVHSITPKAGFLAMTAAFVCNSHQTSCIYGASMGY